jgi:hypothetical protein
VSRARRVRPDARVAHPLPRFGQQGAVDVEPDQLDGLEAVVEHGQRDTASAADLEHLRAARQLQRADHEGNLQQRLEAVARLYVAEGHVIPDLRWRYGPPTPRFRTFLDWRSLERLRH